jgi:hypothetical protein
VVVIFLVMIEPPDQVSVVASAGWRGPPLAGAL